MTLMYNRSCFVGRTAGGEKKKEKVVGGEYDQSIYMQVRK
jgi:hypothetical protein